jgi:Zn finger protein HypA/HybF involved in hydrogenase expression
MPSPHVVNSMFVKLQSGERQCLVCFKTISNFRNHYYIHRPGNFKCPVCARTFARMDQMKQHARSVHALAPFVMKPLASRWSGCVSGCAVRHRDYDSVFIKLATGARECRLCRKVVMNYANHYLVHFREKFACPYCPSSFSRPSYMKQHIKVNHQEAQPPKPPLPLA